MKAKNKCILITMCTVLLTVAVVAEAQTPVVFNDGNLKQAVIDALKALNPQIITDTPTQDDMLAITQLHANNKNIVNLTGLEYATNLWLAGLDHNKISDLSPLSGLTSLTRLGLIGNEIDDIGPLSNLTNLILLILQGNDISDITALEKLTNLEWLHLNNNAIGNDDMSLLPKLTNLHELWLQDNQISNISALSTMTSLTNLQLAFNDISILEPLESLINLADLSLGWNPIESIDSLSELLNLEVLGIQSTGVEGAGISDLAPLENLTKLWYLATSSCREISDIGPLENLTNLRWLSIQFNNVSNISPLAELLSLEYLDLVLNPLNREACEIYIPQIIANNPGMVLRYDSCVIIEHILNTSSTTGGSVTVPGEGRLPYDEGSAVPVTATPQANYHFVNWTGTAVEAGTVADTDSVTTTVTVEGDYTLVANFAIDQRTLSTSSSSGGSVSMPGEGSYSYTHGTSVSIAAAPQVNYGFVNWTGTAVSAGKVANATSASTTVTMDGNYTLVANFAIGQRTLNTSSSSGGSVSTPGEGGFSYAHGALVSVAAVPQASYSFVNWTGSAVPAGMVTSTIAANTTVTMNGDYTLVANFVANTHRVTVNASTGGSTDQDGRRTINHGNTLTITPAAASGYSFTGWSGDASGSSVPLAVTVISDMNITANFSQTVTFQTDSVAVMEQDITSHSVILRGRISDDAGESDCWYRFRYFKKAEGFAAGISTEKKDIETVNGQGQFTQLLEGLDPNGTYRYQASAGNDNGSDIGRYMEFTTKPLSLSPLDVLHVDDNALFDPGPNDLTVSDPNEDGSPEHPFDGIQEAIDVARDHVLILVKAGRYVECLDFKGKSIEVDGLEFSNQDQTQFPTIDADNQGTVVIFNQAEDVNSVLSGFVLTQGADHQAAAITCIGSSPTIRNCLIVGNRSSQATIYCVDSDGLFENCTIADNYGGEDGSGISVTDCNIVLSNSIVWSNAPQQIQLISGNDPSVLNSCMDTDPLFAFPGYWTDFSDPILLPVEPNDPNALWLEGDYHLQSLHGRYDPYVSDWIKGDGTSNCIDLGDPNQPIGQEVYPHGDRINAGAYGGTWMASRSGQISEGVSGASLFLKL